MLFELADARCSQCIDLNGLGIEEGGFGDSCREVTQGFYGPGALFGFDLSQYVFPACTFF